MKKTPLIVVAVIVVVGIAIALTVGKSDEPTKNSPDSSSTSTNATSTPQATDEAVPTNAVSIENMTFTPKTITVPAGATVHWNNNDSVAHTVTADDNSFDSGSIEGKGSFTHTFDTAGTYKYHCTFHNSMTGTVVVR